jgi:hypothetical protein
MCLLRLDRIEKPYLDPDIHPMDVLLYRARAEDWIRLSLPEKCCCAEALTPGWIKVMYSSNSGTAFRLQSTAKSWKPDR